MSERVAGIGGVFFRARDPKALRAWYAEMLGIDVADDTGAMFADGGPTVWSIFEHDTTYFGPSGQQLMVNYRVRDLDAMLEHLRAQGVQVDARTEDTDYGRFGWAVDPEGNRFELWEPKA